MPGLMSDSLTLLNGQGFFPGRGLRPVMKAPSIEGSPFDVFGQVTFQLVEAALDIVDQGAVMGKNEKLFLRVQVVEQAQAVQQNQSFTAASHAIDDVQTKIGGESLSIRFDIQVGFHRCFLIVIQ